MSVYQSLADFYKRRGGRHSPESDYGAQNYLDKTRVPGDTWRVSHVEETGDFYAVRHRWNSDNIVILLGRVPKELSEKRGPPPLLRLGGQRNPRTAPVLVPGADRRRPARPAS